MELNVNNYHIEDLTRNKIRESIKPGEPLNIKLVNSNEYEVGKLELSMENYGDHNLEYLEIRYIEIYNKFRGMDYARNTINQIKQISDRVFGTVVEDEYENLYYFWSKMGAIFNHTDFILNE